MKREMKQFHMVGLVSLVMLGFMLIQSISLIGAGAASGDFGFRILDQAIRNPQSAIRNLESGRPWINLHDGVDLPTAYIGAPGLQQVLEQNLALPLALASADFDEDGVPDVVSGYVGPGGGILTLHRGNLYSIYPTARETSDLRPQTQINPPSAIRNPQSKRPFCRRRVSLNCPKHQNSWGRVISTMTAIGM